MKILIALLFVALFAAMVFWLLKPRDAIAKNTRNIRDALDRLLRRPYGAHLIIEEPAFGKFVQFSGSVSEPLLFDLQRQNLTLDEFDRANQLFHEFGYPAAETFAVFDGSGRLMETQTSFLVSFEDTEAATALALAVFARVFHIDRNITLNLIES